MPIHYMPNISILQVVFPNFFRNIQSFFRKADGMVNDRFAEKDTVSLRGGRRPTFHSWQSPTAMWLQKNIATYRKIREIATPACALVRNDMRFLQCPASRRNYRAPHTISNLNYLSLNWKAPPLGVADYVIFDLENHIIPSHIDLHIKNFKAAP